MFDWLYKKPKSASPAIDNSRQDPPKKQEYHSKEDNYVLVWTERIEVTNGKGESGKLYFYLYEDTAGKRKMEYKISVSANDNFNSIPYYCEKVYPWLKGQDFPDIPSYWDIVKKRRPDDIKNMYKRYFNVQMAEEK